MTHTDSHERQRAEELEIQAERLRVSRARASESAAVLVDQLLPVVGTSSALCVLAEAAFESKDRHAGQHDMTRRLTMLGQFDLGPPLAYFPHVLVHVEGRVGKYNSVPLVVTDRHMIRLSRHMTLPQFQTHPLESVVIDEIGETRSLGGVPMCNVRMNLDGQALFVVFRGQGALDRFLAALHAAPLVRDVLEAPARAQALRSCPAPRLIRTPRDAEAVAAEWLTHFGLGAAQVTRAGPDGGLDVVTPRAVAQVKMEGLPVGRPVVQQLHGCACVEGKTGYVFALSGFTPDAIAWADRAGVGLFSFDFQGQPVPQNSHGRRAAGVDLPARGGR